ncbi:MAG: hypothetical protein QXD23_00070 [Candidatus Micrarchaeaceae archaeon]
MHIKKKIIKPNKNPRVIDPNNKNNKLKVNTERKTTNTILTNIKFKKFIRKNPTQLV